MPEENNEAHFLARPFPWKRTSNCSGKSPVSKASLSTSWSRRRKGGSAWMASNLWTHRSPRFWTCESCLNWSNWLFVWEHPFTDKRAVITEPAVPRTRRSGLGSKLYPTNVPRMLNKDLTWFMHSLFRVRQKLSKLKKGLCCNDGRHNVDNPNSRLFWGLVSQLQL